MSKTKTKILNLNETSFSYLSWDIHLMKRTWKNKTSINSKVLIIKPTSKAVKRIMSSIRKIFKSDMPMKGLIQKLNPIIRG